MNEFLATYAAPITSSAFMFAFGACVGSLTNVLVYRLPRGLDVVAPPSRCPACDTRLTWRENIPVFGWLALGGRCRFCKSRISPEYPLVEAFVGLLFVLLFVLWYVLRPGSEWLGVDWGRVAPEWAGNGFGQTWPAFVTLLVLASSLVAMTLVDFKTFTIPMVLTTVPAIVGLVAHPAHALWIQLAPPGHLRDTADGEVWTIATFGPDGWAGLGAGIGGMVGLAISMLLLRFRVITRSFADYDEWERKARGDEGPRPEAVAGQSPEAEPAAASPGSGPSDLPTPVGEGGGDGANPPEADADDEPRGASPRSAGSPIPPEVGASAPRAHDTDLDLPVGPRHEPSRHVRRTVLVYTAAILGLGLAGAILAPAVGVIPFAGVVVGALLGPIVAGLLTARDVAKAAGTKGSGGMATPSRGYADAPGRANLPHSDAEPSPCHPGCHPDAELAYCDPDQMARTDSTTGGVAPADPAAPSHVGDPDMWLAYPHARREMVRELAFVCPAIVLALAGAALFRWLGGPWSPDPMTGELLPAHTLPLWAVALGGSLMGYLIGGAVVWGVRIFGSLGFGKEAMGMGDVHLMAAVGACSGWIDATLAFFLAAFVGVYWVIASAARSGGRVSRAMPFGPYLAVATMLVIVGKPAVEAGLELVMRGVEVDLP